MELYMKRETENLNPKKEIDPSKIYLMLMVLNYDNIAIKFPKKKKEKKKHLYLSMEERSNCTIKKQDV